MAVHENKLKCILMTNTIHYAHICLCVSVSLHKDTSATKADFWYLLARTTSPKSPNGAISVIILFFFPMPNYYVAHGLFLIPLPILFCHSSSSFWPDLSLLTNRALKAYLSLFSFCLGGGVGVAVGVMALLRQKNQTHCSISLLLAPSFCLLKFWCWMVTHCEIASCLGGLCGARSGSYIWPSLDSDF